MRAACTVTVNGRDISSALLPYLTDLTVTDRAGATSDACEITLDDRDGILLLPRAGVPLTVALGWQEQGIDIVFAGTVDEVHSAGSRDAGRTLRISARGVDTAGNAKAPQQRHWDSARLGTVMTDAAAIAGIPTMVVDSALAALTRPYWAMQTESFLHFGERIAREVGGTFKVAGSRAILARRNGGTSASGKALPTVTAAWGVNLLSWELSPAEGRPQWKQIKVRHYDRKTATWKETTAEVAPDADAAAELTMRFPASDDGEADEAASGAAAAVDRAKGGGSIVILGDTAAQPEGTVTLSGARPGIDGVYRIDTVTHRYSREAGFTTALAVKQPSGDAGTDSRTA